MTQSRVFRVRSFMQAPTRDRTRGFETMPDRSLSQQPSLCGRRSDRPLESTEEIVCYDLVDAFAAQTSAVVSGRERSLSLLSG